MLRPHIALCLHHMLGAFQFAFQMSRQSNESSFHVISLIMEPSFQISPR